ncbi:Uncharacterized protein BP5553_09858 [Venustampulla echinocandica]|uniref:FAD-binding PCMH-type domain-containing protein n=1 Tax=Venustampulla echinocandica TaxID=2656787 RepID=A0A370TAW5_9HELO|nr:Uncharacterized protein BP5553_09858 [Venustampulla echinocandica]RDL31069.1 Uncharacterized protein BP5553_09858 [Venustampulla echinocandica]
MAAPALPIVWKDAAGENNYEKERVDRIFNAIKPNRYPRAIIKATHPSHVQEAVQLANKLQCRVSVRSGGHSWAAWSVRDDAILIDLEGLHEIDLDEDKTIVKASPSTTGAMLNEVLVPKGLMFGGGHCPDVGIGGFLLQGGMGWNCKNWGWACEQIVALDVVTAAGEALHCSETENSDLLWCARGAGPGFPAIVTRFYLKTRQRPAVMYRSTFIYPISVYKTVMDWITKISPTSDPGNEIVAVGLTPKGMNEICIMAHIVTFQESESAAREALRPLDESRPVGALVELVSQPTSIADQYVDQAHANPENHRYCADNAYIKNDADVTGVLEKAFTSLPHRKSFALWFSMVPTSRRPMPDMACSMQSDHYFALYTVWEDAEDDVRCQGWVKNIMREVAPMSEGAYLGDSDFQVRRTKFWSDAAAAKLMSLRRKWDPKGTVSGYLDEGDASGTEGLDNQNWIKS